MPIYQAVILALVQAITEFLPISSSAHLALAPWLLGWKDQGLTFDIALHFGTLIAILLYFARDWMQIFAQAFGVNYSPDPELRLNRTLLWLLAVAVAPDRNLWISVQKGSGNDTAQPDHYWDHADRDRFGYGVRRQGRQTRAGNRQSAFWMRLLWAFLKRSQSSLVPRAAV